MKFFISYVFEDGAYKSQLADWALNGMLGPWEAVYESEDLRQDGRRAVRWHLNTLIQSCDAVVVLVGQNSHDRPWLEYEIQDARSARIPVITVRIPNTTGGPPRGAPQDEVGFRPIDVRKALSELR